MTFDFSQPSSSTREIISTKPAKIKNVDSTHKKTKKDEQKVSIKFIRKLSKLGIPEDSAAAMAELKLDWDSVIAKNKEDFKIHCIETKCKFRADMTPHSLEEHCVKVHEWGEYKCTQNNNCQYVSHHKELIIIPSCII